MDVPFSATARYLVEAESEEAALVQGRVGKAIGYELIGEQIDEHARWAISAADGQPRSEELRVRRVDSLA